MPDLPITQGWAEYCEQQPSSHFNLRPEGCEITLLVIHNISLPPGQFGSDDITDFFIGKLQTSRHPFFKQIENLRVSAHCLVRRDGLIIQYVSFDDRAWHAGVSSFEGRENCNDFSIGIEVEGTDDTPYTDEQYAALTKLTMTLQQQYSKITADRIVGHCHIAPERKTDPGRSFDWPRYLTSLA
ncbi:MAG: 1,6-anhydro-N-acetylmuramyl-L-alanine amidase AmpD [Algicola sp.]|nr:1,6-anhydro-N-acetylmuramyl-L-alanine amidase AmpD [Algicola sp.]